MRVAPQRTDQRVVARLGVRAQGCHDGRARQGAPMSLGASPRALVRKQFELTHFDQQFLRKFKLKYPK
jgi:hypothetical protein